MDGLSGAASVIAVIGISAKVTSLCVQYSLAVKDAKDDIERVQKKVGDTTKILEKIKLLLERQDRAQLTTTHSLFDSLSQCLQELEDLKAELEPGKTRKAMKRISVRALKWPFTSKQVDRIASNLEGYEQAFTLALQVDQSDLLFDIDQKLDMSKLPIAKGASFDSHNEEHNARCLPNTRTALLNDIAEWAKNKDGKAIFWLSGMAGTGKSTIARTVAQSFATAGQLGASFFFKKGEGERGNASRFFSTIATDLVACEPGMFSGIRKALDEDSVISERALKDQFEKLILRPLSGIQQTFPQALARIVVIDALDECEREEDARVILQLLAQAKDMQPVSLRIFVTSRPELHIRFSFKQLPDKTYQDLVLHEVPKTTVEHDIRIFLEHELIAIREARMLSPGWPTTGQLQALVELAMPLFIYAATVCRYIGTKGGDPEEYLSKVLQYRKSTFSQLDRTYLPVLDQLLSEQEEEDKEAWLDSFRRLVGSIVILESPLSVMSLAHLLQVPRKQIECRLDSLHSVLSIPDNKDIPVTLLHLSFREFLVNPGKQGKSPFWIDEKSTHKNLASYCIELMSTPSGLRKDICNLLKPGTLRNNVDEGKIAMSLPPELQYACRYWVDHLEQSQQTITDEDMTHCFLQKHLLHWLEAMSLMRETSQCVHLLERLQALVETPTGTLLTFLRDANRFLLRFRLVLAEAPLQIYSSALVFAPQTSVIRKTFIDQIPQWVEMLSAKEADWDACRSVLEGHSDEVNAVVISSDGQLAASASDDNTIKLWEMATGKCWGTLEGHSNHVIAVTFSPNGQLLASASYDKTVRLWDIMTGTCLITLEGHSNYIRAVTFSPNGHLVASASSDKTVRLWETATGICQSILEGHSSYINAVAFSPNGQLVVSASNDSTVRLWELATGMCRSVLEGHFEWVNAVTFSPNGRLLASASYDKTVRLWDIKTKTYLITLEGHSEYLNAMTFSPNGQLLASASCDNTVRLWKTTTGTCQSILEGHSGYINAVAFSPNGQLVVSASNDNTLRVWETVTGMCRSTSEGHSDWVNAVTFSPNGQLAASASYDNTVRLWDMTIGTCRSTLKGHSDWVNELAFSPDGQLVASASRDKTVRLWETTTGICRSILEGHSNYINAVAFSPNGQLVASASNDITIRLWDITTETCQNIIYIHFNWVNAVTFSPNGQLLASGSCDNTVRLWDITTGTCRSTLKGHSDWVNSVAFSPNGQLVASASFDNTIRLWDTATGICRSTLEGHSNNIRDVTFSPDGQVLYTSQGDIRLSLASVRTSLARPKRSRHISVQGQWILRNHQPYFWLPPEYRPVNVAVCEDLVCLAQLSGRVDLLRVR